MHRDGSSRCDRRKPVRILAEYRYRTLGAVALQSTAVIGYQLATSLNGSRKFRKGGVLLPKLVDKGSCRNQFW